MRTILFCHIPKAAGTTLFAVLRNVYGRSACLQLSNTNIDQSIQEYVQMPDFEKAKIAVIEGHFPVGLHRHIPHSWTYITVLRDPVERVISHYYHILNHPNHYAYTKGFSTEMSLGDYMRSGIAVHETHNGQIWFLSGGLPSSQFQHEDRSYELAKHHIIEKFTLAAPMDMFDEALILLKRRLDWKSVPFYHRRHVSGTHIQKDNIPVETISEIKERNSGDIKFYSFAVNLFKKELDQLDNNYWKEVKRFKLLNNVYQFYVRNRFILGSKKRSLNNLLRLLSNN